MIGTLKGHVKTCQRPGFYAIALLLVINTVTVAWLMHAGISDWPGWSPWRLSLVISPVLLRLHWAADRIDTVIIACIMTFCWALLPAGWLAVALWNGHFPVMDPAWLIFPCVVSTFFCCLMTLMVLIF